MQACCSSKVGTLLGRSHPGTLAIGASGDRLNAHLDRNSESQTLKARGSSVQIFATMESA